jgi:hypothetical protein
MHEQEASPAVFLVTPPGHVEVDVARKDDFVNLGGRRLYLVLDPVKGRVLRGKSYHSLYKPPTRKRFPKLTSIHILCTAECIKSWRIFVSAANSDLTTTITRYFAVFNLSEWVTGRNVWYPSTLKSLWLLVGITVSVMIPKLMLLSLRRLSKASSLPLDRIPFAFHVLMRFITLYTSLIIVSRVSACLQR